MRPSRFRMIQALFNRLVNTNNLVEQKSLLKVRQAIVRYYDPLVEYTIAGTGIVLPFSHDLPLIRKSYPHYSSNVARVATAVHQKYPDLTFVDIGANVGDTVAILRELAHFPILCIEGDRGFFEILKRNVGNLTDVYVENSFVSVGNALQGKLEKQHGTAHFVESTSNEINEITNPLPLSDILEKHEDFTRRVKMVKIDTDGFDVPILCSEQRLLRDLRPAVFFEYDPHFTHNHEKDGGYRVFGVFAEIGYSTAIFYDNFGDYLLTIPLSNKPILEDIHQYFSGRAGSRYYDIVLFPEEDGDLAKKIRVAEHVFFQAFRNF